MIMRMSKLQSAGVSGFQVSGFRRSAFAVLPALPGMFARLLCVLAVALPVAGCAHKPVRVEPVAASFQFPEELAAVSRPLKFLVMWYYRASSAWPENRDDLVDFLKSLDAPLSLDNYPEIEFVKLSEEYVECRFVFDAQRDLCDASGGKVPDCRIKGMFSVSQAETATDGVSHVGLEPMLTFESMLLPETARGAEESSPGGKPGRGEPLPVR